MKKNIIKVKDLLKLEEYKVQIKNALKEGKAEELSAALLAALDEIKNAVDEVDEEALRDTILSVVNDFFKDAEPNAKTNEAIANAIAKRMAAVNNSIKKELPAKVKNAICAAILHADGKASVENAVNQILVENGISGLTFEETVDYAIVENWGDLNPLFKQLHKTMYTKFFYNDDELKTATLLAKQWDKTGNAEKVIQAIAAEGKTISTKYVYKRQQIAQEDLDEIERAGEVTNFLRFINEELDRMIVNTIVMAILIGDTVNASGKRVTTFESIATKTAEDVFTSISNPASAGTVTLKDLRLLSAKVKNPYMKHKVMLLAQSTLTSVAEFIYAEGGSTSYRTNDEVAKQIGVDEIITTDLLDPEDGVFAICMIPDGYWYNEKKALVVTYPQPENNVINYQKERNIGGGIHDLYSTAVLKAAAQA